MRSGSTTWCRLTLRIPSNLTVNAWDCGWNGEMPESPAWQTAINAPALESVAETGHRLARLATWATFETTA